MALIDTCLAKWEGEVRRYEGKVKAESNTSAVGDDGVNSILLVRTVLDNARGAK